MKFNGFISYSHAADGRLAPAVQRGLHRLAKPWHRRRALWIFRDQTGLSVTPGAVVVDPAGAGRLGVVRAARLAGGGAVAVGEPRDRALDRDEAGRPDPARGDRRANGGGTRSSATCPRTRRPCRTRCAACSPRSRSSSTCAGPATTGSSACSTPGSGTRSRSWPRPCTGSARTSWKARTSGSTVGAGGCARWPWRRWRC